MNLIVCVDEEWGIGKDGALLANIPGDLRHFREKTLGKVVVMGRSTLESLPGGKPLPNRVNIVLTHRMDFNCEGVTIVHDMEELMYETNKYMPEDIFIMGGASVYNELLDMCDTLYITKIFHSFGADVKIKNVDEMPQFKITTKSDIIEENGFRYQLFEYNRKRIAR